LSDAIKSVWSHAIARTEISDGVLWHPIRTIPVTVPVVNKFANLAVLFAMLGLVEKSHRRGSGFARVSRSRVPAIAAND
jgi:hypothetical protein